MPAKKKAARSRKKTAVHDVKADRDVILGDQINHFYQQAQSAAEAARQTQQVERVGLAESVSALLERLKQQTARLDKPGDPYKGLMEYRLDDAHIFFGREQETAECLGRLGKGDLTVLTAASAAGKTSLLQAGLAPQLLAEGHLPIYIRPRYVDDLVWGIKTAFVADLDEDSQLGRLPLEAFLRHVRDVVKLDKTLCLFLDQFEEFFRDVKQAEARAPFFKALAACLNDASLRVKWVLAMQPDAVVQFQEFESFYGRPPLANLYSLRALTVAEADEVVERSAAQRGLTFGDGLAAAMLRDLAAGEEVSPAELQLVSVALTDSLPAGAIVTLDRYQELHGAAGILKNHLQRELALLPNDDNSRAWQMIESLVTADGRRAVLTHAEFRAALARRNIGGEQASALIEFLRQHRLLRVREDSRLTVQHTYELMHDYLLGAIELDPKARARKEAEELLAQGLRNWRRPAKLLIDPAALIEIEKQQANLIVTDDEAALLVRSAAVARRPVARWRNKMSVAAWQELIADLDQERHSPHPATRANAVSILWALRPGLRREWLWSVYGRALLIEARRRAAWIVVAAFGILALAVGLSILPPRDTGWLKDSTISGLAGSNPIVVLDPDNPAELYIYNAYAHKLWQINADARSATSIDGLPTETIAALAVAGEQLYVATVQDGIYQRSLAGADWRLLTAALDVRSCGEATSYKVAVNPRQPNEVYAAYGTCLWATADSGQMWERIDPSRFRGPIHSLATNGHLLAVAGAGEVWWREVESAGDWVRAPYEPRNDTCRVSNAKPVTALALPNLSLNSRSVWAVVGNAELCNGNLGKVTTLISATPPQPPFTEIRSLAVWESDAGEKHYYVGNDQGLFCRRAMFWNDSRWWSLTPDCALNVAP